jgi:hypothetical protein
VFDAYAQFEELSLSKRMEEAAGNSNPAEEGKGREPGLFKFNTFRLAVGNSDCKTSRTIILCES